LFFAGRQFENIVFCYKKGIAVLIAADTSAAEHWGVRDLIRIGLEKGNKAFRYGAYFVEPVCGSHPGDIVLADQHMVHMQLVTGV